jgi:hypothetical protein
LLSEQPHKNCDPVAAVRPERSAPQLPYLLTDLVWDEAALTRQRIAQRLTLPSDGEGVRSFAETGCDRKGRPSVGGARQ